MDTIRILSTRILPELMVQKLADSGLEYVQHNFIEINPLEFNPDLINMGPKHWIITSQNAWRIMVDKFTPEILSQKTYYCVGSKTKSAIESEGYPVFLTEKNSKTLAKTILTDHSKNSFQYFSGDQRITYLPNLFQKEGIDWYDNVIYSTQKTGKKIDEPIDGIMFFSPSGVQSYFETNLYHQEVCFCIGSTTSISAEAHSNNIIIAENQTFESVIDSVIKHYT